MEFKLITSKTLSQHVGSIIALRGHVQTVRRLGNLVFAVVRDIEGVVQVVIEGQDLLNRAEALGAESPVSVIGEVVAHPSPSQRAYELRACSIEVLAAKGPTLPVEISKHKTMDALPIQTLLEHRPLTLRNEKIRSLFRIQDALCHGFRTFLRQERFTEIHSPKIVSTGTEGGAQLFALEYFGKRAYLAQSPQFYKQMMVAVFERVYEIGPVYRAEEHDTTRHLNEYISMDVEMGFISCESDLMNLEMRLLKAMFDQVAEECSQELALYGVSVPEICSIPTIKLADACELLRKEYSWGRGTSTSCDLDPEGERLLCEHFYKKERSQMVFVTHYPWIQRPFYAMPEQELSRSFDLLYKGLEITTGGQRVHEHEQLISCMKKRHLEPTDFADYLQCFKYGMPPHGGFAIGLERLTKQLLNLASVKQAALFPRDRLRLTP